MSNTKAEIVDAARAAGILDPLEDVDALTKAELLALWG
jgi:hypothetical protein